MAEERKKNPAAVALGRLGGKRRAANLSAEELSEQAKRAAAARWAKARAPKIELVVNEPVPQAGTPFDGHDSNAIQALKDQGYEVGEPAQHPDGVTRVNVRSHDVSAWVATGTELLDLAAGRVTLEILNRRREERRNAAAAGRG